jgi:hypothetical protein
MITDHNDGWLFPMKSLFDFVQRSALYKTTRKASSEDDTEQEKPVFDYTYDKSGECSSGAEAAEKLKDDNEASFADYWEINEDTGECIYHHVMSRKQLFVPHKAEGSPPHPKTLLRS